MKRPLPIGISDFKKLMERGCVYVDKTLLIQELVEKGTDVALIPKNPHDLGIVMEFKKIGRFEKTDLQKAVASALQQIEDKKYDQELLARDTQKILHLGFAFEGKEVLSSTNLNHDSF